MRFQNSAPLHDGPLAGRLLDFRGILSLLKMPAPRRDFPTWSALLLMSVLPAFAKVNFNKQVRPILETNCVRCHGGERAMKNLRLDSPERAMRVIVPGKPDDSTLYLSTKIGFMPPGPVKLTPEQQEILKRWIAEGAKWPKNARLRDTFVPVRP